MRILLHVCCGPCTVYPLTVLRAEGHEVEGFFHNPNIHPYQEFARRLAAMTALAETERFAVRYDRVYGLRPFLREVVGREDGRCRICYGMRLRAAARVGREAGCDRFTTTLLYSRYQQHELIRATGERVGEEEGIGFYYQDFRGGWQEGVDRSIAMGLYRQPYCGCIYSEEERYDRRWRGKGR
ncbi:MAG: epoxyqueuosine reductase QueH [Thermodesulfobacteriota bacterium]